MNSDPLTVRPDDLIADIAEEIAEQDYRAAVAVNDDRRAGRPGQPRGAGRAAPAPGHPRRPRRAGAERARRGARRDRRDPRPPPHRLDRDPRPGARRVRPGRLDRHAGHRALPPERDGALAPDGDDAARGGAVGHRDPQLADYDRARPCRDRVPRARARARCDRLRARDVRVHDRRLGGRRRGDRHARREGLHGERRQAGGHRPGRDRRRGPARAPPGARRRDGRGPRAPRPTASTR